MKSSQTKFHAHIMKES